MSYKITDENRINELMKEARFSEVSHSPNYKGKNKWECCVPLHNWASDLACERGKTKEQAAEKMKRRMREGRFYD